MTANRCRRTALLAGLGVALAGVAGVLPAAADSVYKSVDEAGNVTYSDAPPRSDFVDAHRFELPPDITPEQRRAAAVERARVVREADIAQTRRAPRAAPAEIREAERRLRSARKKLADYEEVRDDDWAGTQQGKRGLKPAYYARVDAAKKEVADAQAKLEALRKQGR